MISVKTLWVLFLLSIIEVVTAMYSNKAIEGYPAGLLGDCPNKTTPIPKADLKHLSIIVHGVHSSKRIKYNFFQSRLIHKDPNMDWTKKTMIYVGGYMDHPSYTFAKALEAHYVGLGYNVWLIDENFFVVGIYPKVARAIRNVGYHIGEMLADVSKSDVFDPSKVEMIGLSLGGQTISFISKKFYQLTGKKIGRLTALDPSGPCFRNMGPADRLDESDADFVDVVNTNIDGYGMAAPVGHVNFYVNGGEYQLGDVGWIPCGGMCSHIRAYFIWLSALENPDSFIGIKCDSVQQARFKNCYGNTPQITNKLGININRNTTGVFYLSTSNTFPYYMGVKGLKKDNDNLRLLLRGLFKASRREHG